MMGFPNRRVSLRPHRSPGVIWIPSLILLLCTAIVLAQPGLARAEEAAGDELPDRLMLRAGWAYIFGANTILTLPITAGISAGIDYNNTFGGESSTDSVRVDAMWRFNRRHSVGFSWYRLGLAGNRTVNQDIDIDGTTIDAGAGINSSLRLNLWRLLYNWSFYHSDKVELAISPGFYVTDISFDLTAQGSITGPGGGMFASTTQEQKLSLPLPSIGLLVNYDITPSLLAQVRSDFFYLEIGDYAGSMFEFYAGLEYRLFEHFALGAAYDRLAVNVTNNDDNGFAVNTAFNVLYLYGTVYAFDTPL